MTAICSCGHPLVEDVGDDLVVTISGLSVRFRRHTDFVICTACLAGFRVEDLRLVDA